MDDMPDFENESKEKLRWFIANFPSPHPFFKPAMAALERKEAEESSQGTTQPTIQITGSSVANINLGSQVGAIAAHTTSYAVSEFPDQIRQVVRIAKLEWSLLDQPGKMVTVQMVCRRVDELRAGLVLLYGKCPRGIDSGPLRNAIEKLDKTRDYRLGNQIGSRQSADEVCRLMEAALADLSGMVPDAFE
jgi:hypothetical protein